MSKVGVLAGLLVLLIAAAGCADAGSRPTSATSRPPLSDPPDPGPAPVDHGLSDEAIARLGSSTFRIFGLACGRTTEGSGFAVSDEVVVTNAHVLVGVDVPMVETADGLRLDAVIVGFDPVNDLALLQVEGADFAPLPLGEAEDGTIGALFGWESGPELIASPFRIDRPVTVEIEAVGSDERIGRPSYLLAADVEAGDSGAALIDSSGTVVGVAYMSTTRPESVGYAVRAGAIEALIEQGFNRNAVVPGCATTRSDGTGAGEP